MLAIAELGTGDDVLRRNCLQTVTLASAIFALACGNDQRVPTAPTVVMLPPLVCPTDVSTVSQDGLAVAVHFDVPTVDRVTAVCSPPPGSLFEAGLHEVTCARSDNPDARCSFLVTVTLPGGLEIVSPTSFTVVEGETAVGTLMATDADTPPADLVWSPAGGADSGHFTLDESGALRFAVPKDYEAPDDAGGDGTYELTAQVSDGTDAATAAIRVALANRNEAPTANAGADQSGVQEGATVTLRGGGEDLDAGDMLQYAWMQTGDATVTLSTPAAATTTFAAPTGLTADVVLLFTLRVTDAGGLSAADTVAVTVVRGGGQTGLEIVGPTSFTVVEGETAVGTLMATDADTPPADLVWSPAGGADSGHFTLDESGALRFAVPKDYEAPDDAGGDGTYELTAQVSDGTDAATAAIRVALANRNEAPTANAGADQSGVQEGATVTLRGGGEDPDAGDMLQYAWMQTGDQTVTLSTPAAATTTFAAPIGLTADVVLLFTLQVTDAGGLSAADTVAVTVVRGGGQTGLEIVGPTSFTVVEGETAVGTLMATDADTPPADLVWSSAGGADSGHFTLDESGALRFAVPKDYEAPDDAGGDGTYELTAQVSDGTDAATAAIRVALANRNEAPTANAGADQSGVQEGATVTLRGGGEDPDAGDMLQYAWMQTGDQTVTLSTPAAATTTFAAPIGLTADVVLLFTLQVTDAGGLSAADTVAVTVVRGGGQTGLEIVGPTSFTVVEGETAVGTLMATDADTPPADLVWSSAGGADSGHFTLDESGALRFAVPKDYEAPDDAGGDGTYELTAQVSDGTDAATAAIRVALANRNEAPAANAGADQSGVQEGATVTLRGGGEDPDAGDMLQYAWMQTGDQTVTLSTPAAATTTFAAPTGLTADMVLRFTLRVTDAGGLSAADTVAVTVVVPDTLTGGICDRTTQVRDAIVDLVPGVHTCSAVTDADLAAITATLNLNRTGISSLRSGDFSGLGSIRSLLLAGNQLTTLPADMFSGLVNVRTLRLHGNELESLPGNLFDGLATVDILDLEYNNLTTVPAGLFDGLNLRFLGLEGNQFQTLPAGVFDSLGRGNLVLDLSHNGLTTLRSNVFAHLDNLVELDLAYNQLPTLPQGVFAGLTSMSSLYLNNNSGADFTFTMTVERVADTNNVVVVVPLGAPFDMTTTISASGGQLPVGVSTVTVRVGQTRSDEMAITPLEGTTVSLGAAPAVPTNFDGITIAVGAPMTF